jgi:hypothetical protein
VSGLLVLLQRHALSCLMRSVDEEPSVEDLYSLKKDSKMDGVKETPRQSVVGRRSSVDFGFEFVCDSP